MYHQPLPYQFKIKNDYCNDMQVVFSEEFPFSFFLYFRGEVGSCLGWQDKDNRNQEERTIFLKTYLFLEYFLILLKLKLYGYLKLFPTRILIILLWDYSLSN